MHDAYRNIAIAKGDPLKTQKQAGQRSKQWVQFIKWCFDWLPDNMVRQIGQTFENFEEVDLQELDDEIAERKKKRDDDQDLE